MTLEQFSALKKGDQVFVEIDTVNHVWGPVFFVYGMEGVLAVVRTNETDADLTHRVRQDMWTPEDYAAKILSE